MSPAGNAYIWEVDEEGPTRIAAAPEIESEPESLDPRKLFTDSVMGRLRTPEQPLDLVQLGAPTSWRPPPPEPPVFAPWNKTQPSEVVSTLGMAHALGAAVVVFTATLTSVLLYVYFH
ncbi:MAG TPA: hypothetical protein VIF62_17985 [Labilithrix sp.]|jgi:hypothetical protein